MGRLMRVRSHASGQLGHLLNQLICMFARAGRHLDRLTCGPPWRRCTGGRWGVGVHGCAADRVQRKLALACLRTLYAIRLAAAQCCRQLPTSLGTLCCMRSPHAGPGGGG